jgi:hypothetical protein
MEVFARNETSRPSTMYTTRKTLEDAPVGASERTLLAVLDIVAYQYC